MKVERLGTLRVHPQSRQGHPQSSLLPSLDAWYAYHRPLATVYLFEACPGQGDFIPKMAESLSRTLGFFPQYAGKLESCPRKGEERQKTRVVWGGSDEPGVEFIESQTSARLQSFLPPPTQKGSAMLWDRTGSSVKSLFPGIIGPPSAMRVQITRFSCGGFSLGLDIDHSLADAHAVGLFMGYWSAMHNELFHPVQPSISSRLPEILWQPQMLEEQASALVSRKGAEHVAQQAHKLPTRRPDLRSFVDFENESNDVTNPQERPRTHRRNSVEILLRSIQGVPCMMQIPGWLCETIVERTQEAAGMPITQQVAVGGFLWAAVNRARVHRGLDPLELQVPTSLRYRLALPEGLLGSPVVAAMISPACDGDPTGKESTKLAVKITETLARYDEEDAMLAVVHDASTRDSPATLSIPQRQSMQLTSALLPASGKLSFGSCSPIFVSPLMPIDNLFVLLGGLDGLGGGEGGQEDGFDVFFQLPEDVLEALTADPELECFTKVSPEI